MKKKLKEKNPFTLRVRNIGADLLRNENTTSYGIIFVSVGTIWGLFYLSLRQGKINHCQ